ncbi:MAG: hypothetical protein JAY75_10565 [Candidatus Thiodiazotropha taylori]|nr:hypothetical protein [Candidatus Thiodiazotropha taylori]MCG8096150.1 hypothetical protein [Candidatus Thiodiazotropha endolucinida]MCG8033266.1 hypothetical protein [Candidatus Thiodiazotropha taylori]MCG8046416.1 hypothetical protein [Candidatus Thiodiazotropha taylori]MCG8076673.1 hypothetical protein [Candidatus Thiodiazotropha taylori]
MKQRRASFYRLGGLFTEQREKYDKKNERQIKVRFMTIQQGGNNVRKCLFAALMCGLPVVAQDQSDTISPFDLRLEEKRRDRLIDKLEAAQKRFSNTRPHNFPCEKHYLMNKGPWIEVSKIKIDQKDHLIPIGLDDIVESYLNKPINSYEICELNKSIQRRYVDEGFITTEIRLKRGSLHLEAKELEFHVSWGKVGQVRVNRRQVGTWRERFLLNSISPEKDSPLHISDIDQIISNLSNGFLDAAVSVNADEERFEYSDIEVILSESGRSQHELNLEQPETSVSYNGILDGPLGNGDLFTLSLIAGYQARDTRDYMVGTSYSLPYGRNRYSFEFNAGQNETDLSHDPVLSKSTHLNFEVDHKIKRSKTLTAFGAVEYRRKQRYWGGYELYRGSEEYAKIRTGLKSLVTFNGGLIHSKVSYHSMFPLMHGKRYTHKLSASLVRSIKRPWADINNEIGFQYAPNELPNTEKITIGSRHTVRGIKSSDAESGDYGFYLSNTLSRSIASPFNLKLNIGIDVGMVYSLDRQDRQILAGLILEVETGKSLPLDVRLTTSFPLANVEDKKPWLSFGVKYKF